MIELINIKKIYESKHIHATAIDDISLTISSGEFVILLGRSGCGKTTLLNILGGIDHLTKGEYLFNGIRVSDLTGKELAEFRNKNIGYVFQGYYLVDELDALHNVELPLGYAGVHKKERRERAKKVLAQVGLEDRMKHYPSQLSGGQQQRVAIARAIINKPEVILADEPTGNLDTQNREAVMKLLKMLNKNGTTIIMVTHDMELTGYASRVIPISEGRIADTLM